MNEKRELKNTGGDNMKCAFCEENEAGIHYVIRGDGKRITVCDKCYEKLKELAREGYL
jgi:protein-arginine kinase activator protein McsA